MTELARRVGETGSFLIRFASGRLSGGNGVAALIFISYRRYDWPFAHRLHEQLQMRLGCEVYIDRKITADDYETELLDKVRYCEIFILIVTPTTFDARRIANREDWIRREVSLALSLGKPIVLVLYEGLSPPPPENLPEDIRLVTRRQGIEFYPAFFEQALEKLVSHCVGLLPPDTIRQIATPPVRPQATQERRLEAAMPAETAQGAATEVRVKVSLTDSKGLRGELPARLKSGDCGAPVASSSSAAIGRPFAAIDQLGAAIRPLGAVSDRRCPSLCERCPSLCESVASGRPHIGRDFRRAYRLPGLDQRVALSRTSKNR